MQEETTQKTIALAIKTSKLTASVLQKAMKMYLEHQMNITVQMYPCSEETDTGNPVL